MNKVKKFYRNNQAFFATFFHLMIPITLQSILGYALNMMDTIMLGYLGEVEISATSLANQPFNIFWGLIFGFGSGASIMIAQYWGKQDLKSINSVSGFITGLCGAGGILFSLVCILFPTQIMSIYSNDPQLIKMGAEYLFVVAFSYAFTGVSNILLMLIRCTEQAKVPLFVSCISLSLNTILNYIFIFGVGDFKGMGVVGAAIATVIARGVEFLVTIWFVFVADKRHVFHVRAMLHFDRVLIRDTVRYALPAVINDVGWSLGVSGHAMIMGRLGVEVVAGYTTANLMEKFCFIVIGGIGSATAVIIGKELGAGNLKEAKRYSKFLLFCALILGIVFGILAIALFPLFIGFFDFGPATVEVARNIIYVLAFVLVTKSLNYTIGVGMLRSGGDAVAVMAADLIGLYCISLPLGFIAGIVLRLPAQFVYLALMSDELVKVTFYLLRYRSNKWVKNITINRE